MSISDRSKRRGTPQSKSWCFTLNNPSWQPSEYCDLFKAANAKFTFQLEEGDRGTPHLQGFLQMETRRKMSTISAIFGDESPHLERTRDARLAEASARTTETRKEGPWTNYTAEELKQIGQGSRTEIAQACERIAAGASMPDVAQEFPTTIVRYHRGLRELGLLLRVGRSTKSFMLRMCGPTGCGKSRAARDLCAGDLRYAGSVFSESG